MYNLEREAMFFSTEQERADNLQSEEIAKYDYIAELTHEMTDWCGIQEDMDPGTIEDQAEYAALVERLRVGNDVATQADNAPF